MKKFKLASVFILSILFSTFYSCDNEPLDSGLIQDVNNPFTNNLVGTWTLVDFNTTVTSTSVFGGMTIESSSVVNGNNPDYDLTFTASTFSSTGGYGYSVTTTVNGQTNSQDLSLENVSGLGNYTTNGSEMTTDGSFFTLEFQGMDLSELQGEQTVPYTISADGQTLTFNQDSTETNNSNGAVITSVITGTSVWSKIANTNQTCADATAFAAAAENAYNNDNNNENLCNAYRSALQNKITACGDANGSIQVIIDGLNCSVNEEALLLKQMIWTELDGTIETEEFFYDGNKLTSVTLDGELAITYMYENDLLTRIESYEDDGSIRDYVLTEYNTSNQLISYTAYIILGNEGLRFDLTYNADGTITEKEYSGDFNSQTSLISDGIITVGNNQILEVNDVDGFQGDYTYDNKNGIYKNISNLQTLNLINVDFNGYLYGGQNNLLSLVENNNSVPYEEYEYTYNSSNYPETSIDYYEGTIDSTREYIYE